MGPGLGGPLLSSAPSPAAGVTWGKVVSLYSVAAGLAVDGVRQAQPAVVPALIDCLGEFVHKTLASWLRRRGGWVSGGSRGAGRSPVWLWWLQTGASQDGQRPQLHPASVPLSWAAGPHADTSRVALGPLLRLEPRVMVTPEGGLGLGGTTPR